MKERRETERNMMIKEEAAEDISGGGRGLPRRAVAASQCRMKKDEACARVWPRSRKEEQSKGLRGEERGEMRRRRIEAGCCAVTVH